MLMPSQAGSWAAACLPLWAAQPLAALKTTLELEIAWDALGAAVFEAISVLCQLAVLLELRGQGLTRTSSLHVLHPLFTAFVAPECRADINKTIILCV